MENDILARVFEKEVWMFLKTKDRDAFMPPKGGKCLKMRNIKRVQGTLGQHATIGWELIFSPLCHTNSHL